MLPTPRRPLAVQAEPAGRRAVRRILSVSLTVLTAVALVGLLPVTVLLGLLVGIARRRRFALLRVTLAITWMLLTELYGIAVLAGIWWLTGWWRGRRPPHYDYWTHRLQGRWTGLNLAAFERIYGIDLQVDGTDCLRDRPAILLMRHTSMIDTLIPPALMIPRDDVRMRYVLKRELLLDPCLDIAGNRTPNLFVDRSARGLEAGAQLDALQALVADVGPNEATVLFPEGTRATPAKRARIIEKLAAQGDAELLEAARRLRHLLPLRLGGAMALLQARPDADLVLGAHHGFEGLAGFRQLLGGDAVGRRMTVRFWRIDAEERPTEPAALRTWLLARWEEVDRAVDDLAGPLKNPSRTGPGVGD